MICLEMCSSGLWKPTIPAIVLIVGGNWNNSASNYPVTERYYFFPDNVNISNRSETLTLCKVALRTGLRNI